MNQKLLNRRKELGIKQKDAALRVRLSVRQYQKIEYGESRPNVDKAIRIAAVLNTPVEELFGDTEHADYSTLDSKKSNCEHEERLKEGEKLVDVIIRASEVVNCPKKVARLMADFGKNGQVHSEEFRPIFEELREVVNGAMAGAA